MWLMVMFDLPVGQKHERKAAHDFRMTLLDLGFEMSQFSVYVRFFGSDARIEPCCKKVAAALPGGGKVHILQFTDKQYERIITYRARTLQQPIKAPDQFNLF